MHIRRFMLTSISRFNLDNFDFLRGVVGPIGQRIVSNDLDLNRPANLIPFFKVSQL